LCCQILAKPYKELEENVVEGISHCLLTLLCIFLALLHHPLSDSDKVGVGLVILLPGVLMAIWVIRAKKESLQKLVHASQTCTPAWTRSVQTNSLEQSSSSTPASSHPSTIMHSPSQRALGQMRRSVVLIEGPSMELSTSGRIPSSHRLPKKP
jgi:hypothetical protein